MIYLNILHMTQFYLILRQLVYYYEIFFIYSLCFLYLGIFLNGVLVTPNAIESAFHLVSSQPALW